MTNYHHFRPVSFLLSLLLIAAARAAGPPEILGPHPDIPGVFTVEPIPPPLLEKIRATTWHAGCPVGPEDLRQLTLSYWNFDHKPATGILIVHKDVAQEVTEIFRDLYDHSFLIERMQPVADFNGSDDASMAANNTSAFNCRDVTGQPGRFSNHSWGRAIDINPLTNPYVKGDTVLPPEGRSYLDRNQSFPGSILIDSFIVRRFAQSGWQWGGAWDSPKDYQHFEKSLAPTQPHGVQ